LLQKYGAEISQNGTSKNLIDAFNLFAVAHGGAGMSGGDDFAIAAEAGRKTLQRAVLMGRTAGNE